jgi:hypothetical protein
MGGNTSAYLLSIFSTTMAEPDAQRPSFLAQ